MQLDDSSRSSAYGEPMTLNEITSADILELYPDILSEEPAAHNIQPQQEMVSDKT